MVFFLPTFWFAIMLWHAGTYNCVTTPLFSIFNFLSLSFIFFKVYMNGILLFTETAAFLNKIRSQFAGRTLNLQGTTLDFSDIEEMLNQERSEFEVSFPSCVCACGPSMCLCYNLMLLILVMYKPK